MKTKLLTWIAALCVLLAAAAPGAESGKKTEAHSDGKAKPANPSLPPKIAAEKAKEEAVRAHIKPDKSVVMQVPPPAARAETKPPAPADNLVWVPGHWAPQDGQWKWVAGQWSVPATPASVWIEAKYDPPTKRWDAGYWQPDRPDSYEGEAPAKETATLVK
jgi:hypothetical protein